MNIALVGKDVQCLKEHFIQEGDKIVTSSPDFVLCDDFHTPKKFNCPYINGMHHIPNLALEAMEYSRSNDDTLGYFIKWFDTDWRDQTFALLPLQGLLGPGLGPLCTMGYGSRALKDCKAIEIFYNSYLVKYLNANSYVGFVSIGIDNKGNITQLHTGLPQYAFYSFLEGMNKKTSDYIVGVSPHLLESWVVNLVVSVAPYPYAQTVQSPVSIDGVYSGLKKHFWFVGASAYKRVITSKSSVLGVATSWSKHLSDASTRAMNTCSNLKAEGIQYRLNPKIELEERWKKFRYLIS